MPIDAVVNGQKLILANAPYIVSYTIDHVTALFRFSSEWDGLTKYATFTQGATPYQVELIEDAIAKDKHLNLASGAWLLSVVGSEMDGLTLVERITTNVVSFTVRASGVLDGEPFPVVGASVGERVLASEADRIAAELLRVAAEEDRETADGLRVTAEQGRDTAEGSRASAEAARVAAEEDRETWYNNTSGTITEALNGAQTAASNAESSAGNAAQSAADSLALVGTINSVLDAINGEVI